jgi:hypothetical protein
VREKWIVVISKKQSPRNPKQPTIIQGRICKRAGRHCFSEPTSTCNWRQLHPNMVVACYNYPLLKSVQWEINSSHQQGEKIIHLIENIPLSVYNQSQHKQMRGGSNIHSKVHITTIASTMGAMAIDIQLSNQRLQVIAQSLPIILPSLMAHNHSAANVLYNEGTLPHLQAPLGFHNSHQPTIITKATTYIKKSSFTSSIYPRLILLALYTIYINKELKFLPWTLIMFPKCILTQDIFKQDISPTCNLCTSY